MCSRPLVVDTEVQIYLDPEILTMWKFLSIKAVFSSRSELEPECGGAMPGWKTILHMIKCVLIIKETNFLKVIFFTCPTHLTQIWRTQNSF